MIIRIKFKAYKKLVVKINIKRAEAKCFRLNLLPKSSSRFKKGGVFLLRGGCFKYRALYCSYSISPMPKVKNPLSLDPFVFVSGKP